MELKKNPHLNLDRYRGLFFILGLIISLIFVNIVFEWKFYDSLETIQLGQDNQANFDTEQLDIPNTEQPPPPPPKTILEQPEIVEVENEEELIKDIEVNLDVEISDALVPQQSVFGEEDGTMAAVPPPPPEEKEEEIFLVVEENPEPKGGFGAFYTYVSENLQYPVQARKMGVQGKVFLQFIIDKDGTLKEIVVVKGMGFGLDEEAVRVISGAPAWKPGKQRGKPVKVRMTIPIKFVLIKN